MTPEIRALIIDDEPDIRQLLTLTLSRMGLECDTAADIKSAMALLNQHPYALCLTDMRLPDGSGIDLVHKISRDHANTPVAMITAYGNVETAVEALKAGAFDFISKPIELDNLRQIIRSAIKLSDGKSGLQPQQTRLIGQSPAIEKVRQLINKLARSQAPVLISGESGTGKELVARLIHEQGPRADQPFVPVNCGAIPSELMESEFFGHKKGSFTGAVGDHPGLFQAADGGTLFLDEIGELPLAMQVKLLRAIQERSVKPVGSTAEISVDVRILSATHQDLAQRVTDNGFRKDLYYRINVINLNVPSLNQRREDIAPIATYILQRLGQAQGNDGFHLSTNALQALGQYHYAGNVRELENILERALALCDSNKIEVEDLQLEDNDAVNESVSYYEPGDEPLDQHLERLEKQAFIDALKQTGGNKTRAAELLGISFRSLRYKLKKLGID